MPALKLLSHTKDWQKTFFYCQETSPEKEPKLPGYSVEHLALNDNQNSFVKDEEQVKLQPLLKKIEVLVAHGLKGTDLIKTWMGWRIQPLSIRDNLMCKYYGKVTDPLRYSATPFLKKQLIKAVKTQLGETIAEIEEDGLPAFSKKPGS